MAEESSGGRQDQDGGAEVLVEREHQGSHVRRELGEQEGQEPQHPLKGLVIDLVRRKLNYLTSKQSGSKYSDPAVKGVHVGLRGRFSLLVHGKVVTVEGRLESDYHYDEGEDHGERMSYLEPQFVAVTPGRDDSVDQGS